MRGFDMVTWLVLVGSVAAAAGSVALRLWVQRSSVRRRRHEVFAEVRAAGSYEEAAELIRRRHQVYFVGRNQQRLLRVVATVQEGPADGQVVEGVIA